MYSLMKTFCLNRNTGTITGPPPKDRIEIFISEAYTKPVNGITSSR